MRVDGRACVTYALAFSKFNSFTTPGYHFLEVFPYLVAAQLHAPLLSRFIFSKWLVRCRCGDLVAIYVIKWGLGISFSAVFPKRSMKGQAVAAQKVEGKMDRFMGMGKFKFMSRAITHSTNHVAADDLRSWHESLV